MPKDYTIEDLERAVSAENEGGLSIRFAQKQYGIPFNTLRRRVKGLVPMNCSHPGPPPALGYELEEELKDVVVEMMRMGHGVSRKEVMEQAGQIDMKSNAKVFKNDKPSKVWYKGFMKRHNLSLRKPEHLSVDMTDMSTVEVKNEFLEKYETLVNKLGVTGNEIFNVDESGLTIVNKGAKITSPTGSKSVVSRKTSERSENVTVMATCNASGTILLPPMVIFKGARLNEDVMFGAPDGTFFATSPKGYIDSELFFKWFVKFIHSIPPRWPVLLLLDGHSSHMSRKIILLARENNIHFLCFPPHTTHLYQALDVGVFGPLKKAFAEECIKLTRKNKRKSLSWYDFCKLLKPAWLKAFTPQNIIGGFTGSGTWPINPNAISNDKLFAKNGIANGLEDEPPEDGENEATVAGPTPSPIIAVVRELLRPETPPKYGRRSRRITKTRIHTSDEFLAELNAKKDKPRPKKTAQKRKVSFDINEPWTSKGKTSQKPKVLKRRMTRVEISSEDESEEEIIEDEEVNSGDDSVNQDSDASHEDLCVMVQQGDHVIVVYEEEFFPGIVTETDTTRVRVSVMTMSGPKGWKWPDVDDLHWYPKEDVVSKIKPPKLVYARGVCQVREIAAFRM